MKKNIVLIMVIALVSLLGAEERLEVRSVVELPNFLMMSDVSLIDYVDIDTGLSYNKKQVLNFVSQYSEVEPILKKMNTYETLSYIFCGVGLVCATLGWPLKDLVFSSFSDDSSLPGIFLGSGVIFASTAMLTAHLSDHEYRKSVERYNMWQLSLAVPIN